MAAWPSAGLAQEAPAGPTAGIQSSGGSAEDTPAPRSGGRFAVTPCGSIVDASTGLEWFVGPDTTMDWRRAAAWTGALGACGGGWSMPTVGQLLALYEPGKTAGTGFFIGGRHWPAHLDPVFSAIGEGSWVWSREEAGAGAAKSVNFNQGKEVRYDKGNTQFTTRAFAVRRAR